MAYFTLMAILIFATLTVEGDGANSGDCPTFWTAFGRSCYRYFGQLISLKEARQNCRIHGCGGQLAYLASIHSQEEQDYLYALAKSYTQGPYLNVWIGLHDEKEEGNFVWSDSSQVDFTSWAPVEPAGGTSEQGVVMSYDGLWHDVSTTMLFEYICKMPHCS